MFLRIFLGKIMLMKMKKNMGEEDEEKWEKYSVGGLQ